MKLPIKRYFGFHKQRYFGEIKGNIKRPHNRLQKKLARWFGKQSETI